MSGNRLEAVVEAARSAELFDRAGTVLRTDGDLIGVGGTNFRQRELARVQGTSGSWLAAECAAVHEGEAQLALLERGSVAVGARVVAAGHAVSAPVGDALLGRVLDGLGRPVDGGSPLWRVRPVPIHADPPNPLDRELIREPLPTGVRAIDGFLTLGRGQRVGILAGSGVGKSTLLGMLARGTVADLTVIALIGERGREVRDFIEQDLGPETLARSVVVAATSDTPAALRLVAARTATAIAEGFREEGRNVLLLFDSLTRVATAQREIGLAAGEPPTTRGYPPSVLSLIPRLAERAGCDDRGSVTAMYTVLVEGDEMDDPIADIARATLDGHIVLRRDLAGAGHYPPIAVLESNSRLMQRVTEPNHQVAAGALRALLGAYDEARDLVNIGAYQQGADPVVDAALTLRPELDGYLRQPAEESVPFDEAVAGLMALAGQAHQALSAVPPADVQIAAPDVVDGDAQVAA